MTLPENIDTTYPDDGSDASVKAHQQHHDEIHAKLNGIEPGADVTDAANVAAAGAVMLTGAQTVAGVKTFSSSPLIPAPTTDLQAATKKYVDDNAGGAGGRDDLLLALDGYKTWAFDVANATARTGLNSGQLFATTLAVKQAMTISSVTFMVGLAGSGYTAGQCFVALYDMSGALLGQTSDISSGIGGTGSMNTVSLQSPVALGANTYVRVAFLITASTMPQLAVAGNVQATSFSVLRAARNGTTYTTPPSTATFPTPIATVIWAALS